jgi:hypothetical protein
MRLIIVEELAQDFSCAGQGRLSFQELLRHVLEYCWAPQGPSNSRGCPGKLCARPHQHLEPIALLIARLGGGSTNSGPSTVIEK